jgi:hypothetical protein
VLGTGRKDNGEDTAKRSRIEKAIENVRKEHQWGDLTDDDYRRERHELEGQLKSIKGTELPVQMPNLERAAELLKQLPELWSHPGVSNEQRGKLVKEVFTRITIGGKQLMSVEPRQLYAPLFAVVATPKKVVN